MLKNKGYLGYYNSTGYCGKHQKGYWKKSHLDEKK